MKVMLSIGLMLSIAVAKAQTNDTQLKSSVDNNTLLWEISGKDLTAPSYLYGTFHLLCKDDIQLSPALKKAITRSSEVYLELDMDDPATLMSAFTLMSMKDGKKLKDLYSPEAYTRISDYFKDSLQMPIGMFQRMKPEFLVALLYPRMLACESAISVEEAVMKIAKADEKEIKGLETMAFQASLFDSIPYEKQAKDLLDAIDSLEKSKLNFDLLMTAYKNQRLDELEKLLNDPDMGSQENMDVLLENRNKNWVQQLKEIMKSKPVFVAVGAGHLVGEKGLISLLRKEGYTVSGLENR